MNNILNYDSLKSYKQWLHQLQLHYQIKQPLLPLAHQERLHKTPSISHNQ